MAADAAARPGADAAPRGAAPLRLAVLGAGRWGRNYIRTIAQIPGAALSCVASKNPETAKLVPAGCRVVADWREALPLCEAVVVATPSSTHAEVALAALSAGKPVLLEKPAAMSAADARKILEEARRRKLHVLVDHILLFHPAYALLKARAAAAGKLSALESVGGNAGPYREDADGLWDYGPHDVAAALDLTGEDPSRVAAERAAENFRLKLEFPSGTTADILVGSKLASKQRRLAARCEKHLFVFDDLSNHKLTCDGHPVAVSAELPLTRCVEAFARNVRAGSTDVSSLELGVRVVAVLERCQAALGR